VDGAEVAAGVITDAHIAAGAITAEKLEGFLSKGRVTMVGGTVTVVPGPAVAATDMVVIGHSGQGGTEGARWAELTAGGAGVGDIIFNSENALDTSVLTYLHCDNTFLG
jgi:hypothetical protein